MRTAPSIKARESAAAIAHGKYLANFVTGCVDCHSQRDWTQVGAPVIEGTEFAGGSLWNASSVYMDGEFPGELQPPNITQHNEAGLGNRSYGEILRAIREGVSRDGRPLAPLMPYAYYRSMSDEDALAVVAYLRSIPPQKGKTLETNLNFPLNLIAKTLPEPLDAPVPSPKDDPVARQNYLVTIGGCRDCHT